MFRDCWLVDPKSVTAAGLAGSDASQAQIRDFELVHPNIYPTDELLEQMKQQVLQIQSYRLSMTQDNHRLSERSPCEDPGTIY